MQNISEKWIVQWIVINFLKDAVFVIVINSMYIEIK